MIMFCLEEAADSRGLSASYRHKILSLGSFIFHVPFLCFVLTLIFGSNMCPLVFLPFPSLLTPAICPQGTQTCHLPALPSSESLRSLWFLFILSFDSSTFTFISFLKFLQHLSDTFDLHSYSSGFLLTADVSCFITSSPVRSELWVPFFRWFCIPSVCSKQLVCYCFNSLSCKHFWAIAHHDQPIEILCLFWYNCGTLAVTASFVSPVFFVSFQHLILSKPCSLLVFFSYFFCLCAASSLPSFCQYVSYFIGLFV